MIQHDDGKKKPIKYHDEYFSKNGDKWLVSIESKEI